jgi:uncharacterized protein (DUF2062 family)
MSESIAPTDSAAVSPRADGFWRRRVVRPIRAQLTQGVTPDRIALTVGVGTACSLFPFLGFTTILNIGAGVALRMNQPILQTLNQLLGPLQLLLILVYVRLGEIIWGARGDQFTVADIFEVFRHASVGEFFQRFGWAGVHALTAWLVTTPILIAALYFSLRVPLRRWAQRRASGVTARSVTA